MPAVLEAFFLMSHEEQEKALASINPSVLGKIRVRFQALSRVVQAFSERLEPMKSLKGAAVVPGVKVAPKAPPVPPPLPPPPPPPRPRRDVQASEESDEELTQPTGFVDQQPLELSRFVWIVLFTTMIGEKRTANLSRQRLVRELRSCRAYNGQPIEQVVYNTIMSAKHRWRKPVSGNEDNQDMARRMHVFYRESGNLPEFEDALDAIVATDNSRDPVELPKF
jgi:hypothetical protein